MTRFSSDRFFFDAGWSLSVLKISLRIYARILLSTPFSSSVSFKTSLSSSIVAMTKMGFFIFLGENIQTENIFEKSKKKIKILITN
jgi:uncharacterized membrane protein YoaT (DUF817 family)